MDRAALVDVVREVAADAIAIDVERVQADSNLYDLGAQSLEFLDIVFKLEQRYDIEITGHAVSDSSVERSVRESVRLRNDLPSGACPA